MAVTIRLRRSTAAEWTASNPTLALGEPGYETDTGKIKYGTGSTQWTSLPYYISAVASHTHPASDIVSGTFADARISQSSVTQHEAALSLNTSQLTAGTLASARFADNTIALTRLANQAQATVAGRAAGAGTGAVTALNGAQLLAIIDPQADDIDFNNAISGMTATNVQDAIDENAAAIAALISGAPEITTLDLSGSATASFPSGANKGDQYIIVNAHASGTTLGSTNQEVVNTDDILLCLTDGASTTNGADWHVKDNTDKVVSVAGKTGSVVLAAGDIASGTFADARIAQSNVTQHQAALALAATQLTSGEIPVARYGDATITRAKLQHAAQATFMGRAATAGTGVVTDLTPAQAVAILLAADGSGSLLDSDLLDGQHGSYYQNAGNLNAGTLLNARVSAGNVTQHQAALSIAGSQLTGTIDGGSA